MATAKVNLLFAPRRFRFGVFELNLRDRDLRKNGLRVKLQEQPLQLLELLLETPGDVVTRDQLAKHLWPGLHVNFERSLNTAVNALRQALGDSSRNPRFIETRPGLGYRFIAPVEPIDQVNGRNRLDEALDSIAVLPFECTGGADALDYLGDGIAESIICTLSAVRNLRIIARSTAFRFRGHDIEPHRIGKTLRVRAVLSGGVEVHGDQVAIVAELVDVNTGSRLWGERYAGRRAEVPSIEKDISTGVLKRLGSQDGYWNSSKIRTYTGSFEAYQNYLKGRYFHNKMTEADLHKSIAYFEAALAEDPLYALAYTGLADTYCLFAFMSIIPSREAQVRAKEYAMAALRIDQDLAEAHASLASLKKLYEWDWAGGEAEYRKALELNPNFAAGHHTFAAHLSAMGRHDEGLEEIRRAQELDPLSLVVNMELAWQLYMARDFQASMDQSWKTLAMEPQFAAAQNTLGLAYEAMGMHEEAIVEFQNARTCSGGNPASVAALAHAYATAGDHGDAAAALRELEHIAQQRYVSPYLLGLVHSGLGRDDIAFEWLGKALAERDVWLVWLKVEPRFDRLRPDPRFHQLLSSIRLASSQ